MQKLMFKYVCDLGKTVMFVVGGSMRSMGEVIVMRQDYCYQINI